MPSHPPADDLHNGTGFDFGRFRLDCEQKVLWRDQQIVPLGPKVIQTLAVLMAHFGQIVSRDELIAEVWGDTAVEDNSLAHNIFVLRRTLREDSDCGLAIETIPRRGYRLCRVSPSETVDAVSTDSAVPVPPVALPGERPWMRRALIATTLLCLCVLGAFLFRDHKSGKSEPRRSVAVVGFASLSPQPDSAWLSSALAEMMTTELAAGGKLLTIPGENVSRAKNELRLDDQNGFSAETLRRLRQNLNADFVVSGAYAVLPPKSGEAAASDNQVRLDLRIQNALTGETLDTVSDAGPESALFDLVTRAGLHVRQHLGIEGPRPVEAQEAESSVSSNPQALRLYAQGLIKLRSFDALGARTLLQQAVDTDPKYALAHSALAAALSVLGYESASRKHAEAALDLSNTLSAGERLFVEGRYRMLSGHWEKAVAIYTRLFNGFPDDIEYGLLLASAQTADSHGADALRTLQALRRLPIPASNDPRISLQEYEAWKSLGDFAHMEQALGQAADTAKEQGSLLLLARARSRQCWIQRVRAEEEQAARNCREAQQIYLIAGDRRGQAEVLRFLGDLVSSTDVDAALSYYRRSLKLEQNIGHVGGQASVMSQMATLYSSQGDHATAEQSYQQALTIFQQTEDRLNATGLMVDIGGELAARGEADEARKVYHDAFDAASAIGNRYIAGLAQFNTGLLQQVEGDLEGAQQSYTQALAAFQAAGSKEYDIAITRGLGEVTLAQGDLAGARRLYEKAISMQQASQQKMSAAEIEMDLAQLSLEEGRHDAELETSLRRIVAIFRSGNESSGNNALNDQALSGALLARCLLAQGRSSAALSTVEDTLRLSSKAEPNVRLSVAIAAARIRFVVQGKNGEAQALASLRNAITVARKFRCFGAELEAQLALGEMEVKTGAIAHGRTRLLAVEKDASDRGFLLLARRAKAAT